MLARAESLSKDDATIERVEAIPLRIPLRAPFKISSGAARSSVEVVIVRMHTKSGVTGVGETQAAGERGDASGADRSDQYAFHASSHRCIRL